MSGPRGECDLAVVGAGILGLATARELARRHPQLSLQVLEREGAIALHQTSHNSGVVHQGVYYQPGSLKAALCVAGARELYEYCDARAIPVERCGNGLHGLLWGEGDGTLLNWAPDARWLVVEVDASTIVALSGKVTPGLSAAIAGSFHFAILPRYIPATVLPSSVSWPGPMPFKLMTSTTPPIPKSR